MEWYAIFVETGKEEIVQKWLRFNFSEEILHSLIPQRKLKEKRLGKIYHVIKKLFPGYIFIYTNMDFCKYKILKSIPGLIRVLATDAYYTMIDKNEMEVILKLTSDNPIIDYSKIFIENSRVYVKSGPLYGMEGFIKKVSKHTNRAKVQLNFMGELRTFDLGVEILNLT